jgi:hypothetical protein
MGGVDEKGERDGCKDELSCSGLCDRCNLGVTTGAETEALPSKGGPTRLVKDGAKGRRGVADFGDRASPGVTEADDNVCSANFIADTGRLAIFALRNTRVEGLIMSLDARRGGPVAIGPVMGTVVVPGLDVVACILVALGF